MRFGHVLSASDRRNYVVSPDLVPGRQGGEVAGPKLEQVTALEVRKPGREMHPDKVISGDSRMGCASRRTVGRPPCNSKVVSKCSAATKWTSGSVHGWVGNKE